MNTDIVQSYKIDLQGLSYEIHIQKQDGSSTGPSTPTNASQLTMLEDTKPEEGSNIQQLAPVDRGFQAWTFCACAFLAETFIWGFLFSYGIFQDYYTSHAPFNASSQVAIAAIGTVGLGVQYGGVLFFSIMFRRYPEHMKTAMWYALALYFVCLFCSSFATQVWHLILLQGVGLGFSGGIIYFPITKLLPQWFSERRGLAGGIIYAGSGVGGFVFPFALSALLNSVGLRWTLRIWAIVSCAITGIAILGIRPRVPLARRHLGQKRSRFILPQMRYFKSLLFLSFSLTYLIQGLSYFPVSLYIASFAQKISTPLVGTVALSLFNMAEVIGLVLLGYLTDHFAYPWVMLFSSVGSALAVFLLWGFAQGPALTYTFAIIFGVLSGGFESISPNAAVDCAGGEPNNADITFAGFAVFRAVSAVIGPIISGMLLEAGAGSSGFGAILGPNYGRAGYGVVEIFAGSCAVAAGLGSIVVVAARRRITRTVSATAN